MKTQYLVPMTLALTLSLAGCGSDKPEEREEPKNALEAFQQMADQVEENAGKEAVDPVDFRELKALLPEKIGNVKRKEADGEKSGAMGFTISKTKGVYQNEGEDSHISVEIMDTGGIAGIGAMALAAWTMADIDKETNDGYEKTTKIMGHKAFEKYNSKSQRGELNVMVSQRFIVNINTRNLSVDQMHDVLEDLDLSKLESLE
ncbi:hypothetical protein [Dyadobacter tibetensis]|uniref:hypothetical protein n=1 Tax=Dyadobacter tibetensis TaxID=1211851 RepID=UPI00046EAE00|nr:hypothetical protein [Dyadobacter tibetensis]